VRLKRFCKIVCFSTFTFLFSQAGEANTTNDETGVPVGPRSHIQNIDGVAAVVGDKVILTSDINQSLAMEVFRLKLDPRRDQNKIANLKNQILQSVVDRKVVLTMAELDSVVVSDKEVDRALDQQVDNILAQAGSEEAAEKALGQPLRSFKREYWFDIKDMLITQKHQQTLLSKVSINKTDVLRFYQNYKDSIPAFPTTAKIRHLLIKITPSEEQVNKTQEFLRKLRQNILDKKISFEEAARTYSQDPGSKTNGGSLGFVRRGGLVVPYEAAAFTLSPGQISSPVKSEFGYHIIETQEIRGDRIKTRHVLMSPPITDKDESIAYSKAASLKDSLLTLALFIRSAKTRSMDEQTSESGGNLGWINPDSYPIPEFGMVLGQIEKNVCAGPVRTEMGYHLLWVESTKPGGPASIDKHWTEIESMALNNKKGERFRALVSSARQNIFVHINN